MLPIKRLMIEANHEGNMFSLINGPWTLQDTVRSTPQYPSHGLRGIEAAMNDMVWSVSPVSARRFDVIAAGVVQQSWYVDMGHQSVDHRAKKLSCNVDSYSAVRAQCITQGVVTWYGLDGMQESDDQSAMSRTAWSWLCIHA